MSTRRVVAGVGVGLLLAGEVGSRVYTAASQLEAREAINATADPTTTRGDLVYRAVTQSDAGLARLGIGGDASVLTSINGVPTWQTASGGGASLPDAAGVPDGSALVTAGGAQAWASPWPGAVVVDPMAGTGWVATATPAGTSATWTASTLVLAVASGASGTVRQTHASEVASGATAWDVAVRVQVTTGAGRTDAATGLYWLLNGSYYVGCNIRADGQLYVGWSTASGSANIGYVATTLSLGGGQSWVRLTRTADGVLVVWYGEGVAGALPTTWARRYALSLDTATTPVSVQVIAAGVSGAPGGDFAATIHAIRTSWSGAL